MKNKIIILLLFSLTSLFALDKPPNSLFEKGNTFYNKGDYQNAIESYLGIIENGYHMRWGLYNFSGQPYVNWYQFAQKIFFMAEKTGVLNRVPDLYPISSENFLAARAMMSPGHTHNAAQTNIARVSNLYRDVPRFRNEIDILA